MKTNSPHTGSSFLNHCHYRSFGGNTHFLYSSGVLEKYDYESGANDKPLFSAMGHYSLSSLYDFNNQKRSRMMYTEQLNMCVFMNVCLIYY